jgi:hypothetical protein
MSVITGLGPRSRFLEFKGARPASESGVFAGGGGLFWNKSTPCSVC